MSIKRGSHVKQVVPNCDGVVLKKQFDEAADEHQYLVEFTGADGVAVRRWFAEDQIVAADPIDLSAGAAA